MPINDPWNPMIDALKPYLDRLADYKFFCQSLSHKLLKVHNSHERLFAEMVSQITLLRVIEPPFHTYFFLPIFQLSVFNPG